MVNKWFVAAAAAVGLAVLGTAFVARARAAPPNAAYASKTFRRSIAARAYQVNPGTSVYSWCVPGETPASVGTILAGTNPGFVSSPLRVENGFETLPINVIADYLTIRNAVLAVNPYAAFGIEVRMNRYTTTTALSTALQTILGQNYPFEAFVFSGYGAATPAMQQVAYQAAKAARKLVGGGAPVSSTYPQDFVHVDDDKFNVDPSTAVVSSSGVPVILGIANGATPVFIVNGVSIPEHDYYVQNLTASQRQQVIQSLAQQQFANGYSFDYPVIHPEAPIGVYLDTTKDGTPPNDTYDFIKSTMDSLNPPI